MIYEIKEYYIVSIDKEEGTCSVMGLPRSRTCQQMLKAFGVQEVRYTTSHGIETQEV